MLFTCWVRLGAKLDCETSAGFWALLWMFFCILHFYINLKATQNTRKFSLHVFKNYFLVKSLQTFCKPVLLTFEREFVFLKEKCHDSDQLTSVSPTQAISPMGALGERSSVTAPNVLYLESVEPSNSLWTRLFKVIKCFSTRFASLIP